MSANPSPNHTSGPCGGCKFLRRKCLAGCIFAPYFDSEQGAVHFAAVHKVFGASNVSKLLLNVPVHKRLDAVVTICYEAQARLRDPVHGCVAHIFALKQQEMVGLFATHAYAFSFKVTNLQDELSYLQAHLATLKVSTPPLPPQPPTPPPGFSITNLLVTSSCFPANYDLSELFNPMMQSSAWSMQPSTTQQVLPIPPPQHDGGGGGGCFGDLHELARELLQRQNTGSSESLNLPPHDSK
ncbi:hypothetical protein L1987_28561 [Smallanthus sonchifolius]|uniref:Uncharacterized protein n=1 Tax=Smallanthus sonchifolius TaxID=185202 RepID=A0ACB9HYZ8_9ASTR|nr:hypothetical protein L1987_28561 [Smallanthus sonchifolius]